MKRKHILQISKALKMTSKIVLITLNRQIPQKFMKNPHLNMVQKKKDQIKYLFLLLVILVEKERILKWKVGSG